MMCPLYFRGIQLLYRSLGAARSTMVSAEVVGLPCYPLFHLLVTVFFMYLSSRYLKLLECVCFAQCCDSFYHSVLYTYLGSIYFNLLGYLRFEGCFDSFDNFLWHAWAPKILIARICVLTHLTIAFTHTHTYISDCMIEYSTLAARSKCSNEPRGPKASKAHHETFVLALGKQGAEHSLLQPPLERSIPWPSVTAETTPHTAYHLQLLSHSDSVEALHCTQRDCWQWLVCRQCHLPRSHLHTYVCTMQPSLTLKAVEPPCEAWDET